MDADKLRVLVVEDSDFVHQIYRVAMNRLGGCTTFHANDGHHGLKLLEREGPMDLIVLDINMPIMDGVTFIRHLRAMPPHAQTHVLVASTEDNQGQLREALLSGASSFLRKPFTLDQIGGLLKRIVPTLPGAAERGRDGAA